MHFPVTIHIGKQQILLHMITELLSFFIGFRYYLRLRKNNRDAVSGINRLYVLLGAIIGALFGSRLLGGMENPVALFHNKNPITYLYENKTIVGGLLGGLIGVECTKKIIGETKNTGDIYVYPIILALCIGRIGCFSMGVYEETYGLPTRWFPGMNLGDGQLRHPVALYEVVFLICLWIVLRFFQPKYELADGGLFKLFMIAYLLFRFLLDFIKPHFTWKVGLSSIQIACILGLVYYSKYILHPKKLLKHYACSTLHLL